MARVQLKKSEQISLNVINGQKKIVPSAIGSKELIDVLSKINMHLSVIALKDVVSEEDMLVVSYADIEKYIFENGSETSLDAIIDIKYMNNLFKENHLLAPFHGREMLMLFDNFGDKILG